jgi:superfamily I DNA/RNA helicase
VWHRHPLLKLFGGTGMAGSGESVCGAPCGPAVLVDEVQDLPLVAMRLCALLASDRPDALFLVGDGQQAIYPGDSLWQRQASPPLARLWCCG